MIGSNRGHRQIMQRTRKVIQRSRTGHAEVTERTYRGHGKDIQGSREGHAENTEGRVEVMEGCTGVTGRSYRGHGKVATYWSWRRRW